MTKGLLKHLRKNPDYQMLKLVCKEYGLKFRILSPKGKGHPKAEITGKGKVMTRPIANSPGKLRPLDVRNHLTRELREKGMIS